MRRLILLLASLGLIFGAALATSGAASAAQSNIKIPPGAQIDLGPVSCAGLSGELVLTVASGHDNINPTPNGFHENATIQGSVQVLDLTTTPPAVLADGGHGEAWFTTNATNGAFVDTDAINAQVGGFNIHETGTFVINANGVPVVDNQTATCH